MPAAIDRPRIAVALQDPEGESDPEVARLKNRRYLEAILRAGGEPIAVDSAAAETTRREAWSRMDGLLLTGGPDIDPARYSSAPAGSRRTDPARDALDAEAFDAAQRRGRPVLGICRGLQTINVLAGGALVQHIEGHASAPYPAEPVRRHLLRVLPDTRLAEILGPQLSKLTVNSYHHQAVSSATLARGLRATALAAHPDGEIVEGLEASDPGRWLMAIQCHPERESSPPELERLLGAFVDACRARA